MRVILLTFLSMLFISCGRVSSGSKSLYGTSKPQAVKEVSMSGVHTGEKWEGKQALMQNAELFDQPALSFEIVSKISENPCNTIGIGDKTVVVTIKIAPAGDEFNQYINFSDYRAGRYLGSPDVKYNFKKTGEVITSIGILFDIDDQDYGIDGYVPVIDCRTQN